MTTPTEIEALVKRFLEWDEYDGSKINDAREEAATALTALQAENERLRTNRDRFPELMARVMAEKNLPLASRIERLMDALADLSPDIARHQWEADEKPAFGEKYVRCVVGSDGEGTGRQWLASTPPHIKGLAEYIAAANPDTVAMLMADLAAAVARAEAAEGALLHEVKRSRRHLAQSTLDLAAIIAAAEKGASHE